MAETFVDWLEELVRDRAKLASLEPAVRRRLLEACGRLAVPEDADKRRLHKALRRNDRVVRRATNMIALGETELRRSRTDGKVSNGALPMHALPRALAANGSLQVEVPKRLPETSLARRLATAQDCYICKRAFSELHFFYDALCAECGDFNYGKRDELADLSGRVALVTGGRVKIGQEIVLKLLRSGARVIVTTRFPVDALRRYREHAEYSEWGDRVSVRGLDLRHTPSVEMFCGEMLRSCDRLDFIVNNACQTVRRPAAFYGHMLEGERQGLAQLGHLSSAELSQLALTPEDRSFDPALFPAHAYDADGQQIDLRRVNSWRLRLHEVPTVELLETQLVNAVAPFILNARLKELMLRSPSRDKHIVNVSAVEGQFARGTKTDKHPHTNMAKAALNMMTRTSAADYAKDGIHMNSVDTGWVTDENPAEQAARKERELGFQPPLDIVDGAARVCDPIVSGFRTGEHLSGLFLKDYKPAEW